MSRKAILIESSQLKDHPDLPGARADVDNFSRFLQSEIGGSWYEWEIVTLHNPARSKVLTEVKNAKDADYSFVTFAGHGYHARSNIIEETRVCLNDTEEMAVSELDPKNDRCLSVIDCCRQLVLLAEAMESVRGALKLAHARDERQARSRRLFEQAVSRAEKGKIVMYSCDLHESADESQLGGLFSASLIACAKSWADREQKDGTLASCNVFEAAAGATTATNSRQHPKYHAGRRLWHFPFGVHLT